MSQLLKDESSIEQAPSVPEDTLDDPVAQPTLPAPGGRIEPHVEEQEVNSKLANESKDELKHP